MQYNQEDRMRQQQQGKELGTRGHQPLAQQDNTRDSDNRASQFFSVPERNYGNCIILSRHPSGEPRFTLGPHYYVFILALIICVVLLSLLIYSLRDVLAAFWFYVLLGCGTTFVLAYVNIGTSVPGFASRAEEPPEHLKQDRRYCRKCRIVRQRGVHHCEDCDVCIQAYDHHCPWIGKCVGSNNLCGFYFFLFMTFGTLVMCFVATVASGGGKQHLTKETGTKVLN